MSELGSRPPIQAEDLGLVPTDALVDALRARFSASVFIGLQASTGMNAFKILSNASGNPVLVAAAARLMEHEVTGYLLKSAQRDEQAGRREERFDEGDKDEGDA